jgi:hypothetical protein
VNNILSVDKKIIYSGLVFLGHKETESKKEAGKFFYSMKFIDEDSNETIELNFKEENLEQVRNLPKYKPYEVILKVGAYEGKLYLQFAGFYQGK